jgi:precorrin-6B methylase 2
MALSSAAPSPDLDLDVSWSLGEAAFETILQELQSLNVRRLVEFGAGASSVRFAHGLVNAQVLSIESDATFFARHQRLAVAHTVPNLSITHRPLRWQIHGRSPYFSYAPGPFPPEVDAVVVDGPPMWTHRGREACLYQILPHLRSGARVYLDDARRPVEQRIILNWMRSVSGLRRLPDLDVGHGVARFEIISGTTSTSQPWPATFDAWRAATRRLLRRRPR